IELDGDNDDHLLDDENLDIPQEPLPQDQQSQSQSKLSGLMSKALGNAMSVASSVEKLIVSSNNVEFSELPTNQQYEELNEHPITELEETEQPQFQDYEIVPEQQEQYLEEDFVVDTNAQNQEDIDDLNFDDINFDNQQLPSLDLDEIIDGQNDIEELNSSKKNKISKPKVEQQATHIPFDELFADVSVEKKRNLTKKDTAVTLHALIGIGNKPYLRSQNFETIPMEYVEIGVWRAILPQFEGEINFTIWKNNEQQIGAESYSVSVGQKQEITI
ncbi:MAG: hypothetical protein J6B07_05955, partial [Opitutales bacterium]|nr:hypothetical protein [Opitutales bacterium]